MKNMIFPIQTEFDQNLPYCVFGVGYQYEQEPISRPKGFPYFQWIQCRRGSGTLQIEGSTYTVSENQGMLLFPNVPHEYRADGDVWEVDWVIFKGQHMADFFETTADIHKSGVYYLAHPQALTSLISKIYEVEHSGSTTKSLHSSKLTFELLMDFLKYASLRNDNSLASQYHRLKPLLTYIESYYTEPLSLETLAQVIHITPQYLCTLFKKTTTHTVSEYVNLLRIKKSKELLLTHKEMQIKEVSMLVGFLDNSYFCATFRKVEHMSPQEFRLLHVTTDL